MPANLGPEYLAAEEEYRQAQTQAEKIAALEKMWAALPKHKGTEKMQADIKKKLSAARKESQKKGAAHSVPFYVIPREGAGQVALVGPPNSGKSQLLCALTHARAEVADYPFTTRMPTPGMMNFENVQIQLVDLPPVSEEFTEQWVPQVLRNANTSVLVVDPGDPESLEEIETIGKTLAGWKVPLPKLLVANKLDLPQSAECFPVLEELYGTGYRCLGISAAAGEGLDAFRRAVFDLLELVRFYTKVPGKKFDFTAPYVLHRGATVLDAARKVHKDFAEHLKFARMFRLDENREGMMVDRHHLVRDEDIYEFHA
jgi:small GTP-binding protein